MSQDLSQEDVQRIARSEAEAVYEELGVEDPDGRQWTLTRLCERFEVSRRTALEALGLIALGYTAPIAILKSTSGTAQAQAATDNLTVPGTVDAGAVTTDELNNAPCIDETYGGNSEIGAAWNAMRSDYPNARSFGIKPGVYTATTALDMTDMEVTDKVDLTWVDLRGVVIKGETSGDPVLDTSSTRHLNAIGGRIQGQATNTPSVGVLQARRASGDNSGQHRWFGTAVRGEYNTAAWYNYGSEECAYIGCDILGDSGDGYRTEGDNDSGVTSPHGTLASGAVSNSGLYFYNGRIRTKANDAASAGFVGRGGVNRVVFDGPIFASDSKAHIIFSVSGGDFVSPKVDGCRFHQSAGGLPTNCIKVEDPDGDGNEWFAPTITNNRLEATGRVVDVDSGLSDHESPVTYFGNEHVGGDAPQWDWLGEGSLVMYSDSEALTNATMNMQGQIGSHSQVWAVDISFGGVNDPCLVVDGSEFRWWGPMSFEDHAPRDIPAGSSSSPGVEIGGSGAGFFVNGSGEVVVVDEAGNTTTLS